jgi:hypothetical protein
MPELDTASTGTVLSTVPPKSDKEPVLFGKLVTPSP